MTRDEIAAQLAEQKKVGGPAFPSQYFVESDGMTLRDYFAAKSMQGICADPSFNPPTFENLAEISYVMADAMLAERSKP